MYVGWGKRRGVREREVYLLGCAAVVQDYVSQNLHTTLPHLMFRERYKRWYARQYAHGYP